VLKKIISLTVGSEYVVIGPMVLVLRPNFSVLVLSLGLVSFGLGLEPCGLVNITVIFGEVMGKSCVLFFEVETMRLFSTVYVFNKNCIISIIH